MHACCIMFSMCMGLAAVAITMIAATATVGYVILMDTGLQFITTHAQVIHQLSGLHVQAFYMQGQ